MVQVLPQPLKHSKSGIYSFRKVVPEARRPALSRREVSISLSTKNFAEAKRLYLDKAAEVTQLASASRQ